MSSKPSPIPAENTPSTEPKTAPKIVRYSLPAMLAELQLERTSGSFSQEKLHQTEIKKLFETRKKRRVKNS